MIFDVLLHGKGAIIGSLQRNFTNPPVVFTERTVWNSIRNAGNGTFAANLYTNQAIYRQYWVPGRFGVTTGRIIDWPAFHWLLTTACMANTTLRCYLLFKGRPPADLCVF